MAGPSALSAVTLPEGLKAVRFRLVSLAPVAVLSAAVMLSLCQKEGMLAAPPIRLKRRYLRLLSFRSNSQKEEDQRGTMSAKVLFLAGF